MPKLTLSRQNLLLRFLQIAQVTTVGAAVVSLTDCGARSNLDSSRVGNSGAVTGTGSNGQGGGTHASSSTGQGGLVIQGSSSASGFVGASGGVGGANVTVGAGGFGPGGFGAFGGGGACVSPPDAVAQCFDGQGQPCAPGSSEGLLTSYFGQLCARNETIKHVFCGPFVEGAACCYVVEAGPGMGCYVGRAFLVDEGLLKSELRKGDGWRTGPSPDASVLDAPTRIALRDGWLLDALFEHASVASFARLTMQMLAVGAPADLVRDSQKASIDEIRHAELCFALASAYAGEALEPAPFPIGATVAVGDDLVAIAVESVVEGCIGETLAAVQAEESLLRARDPAVIAALTSTVEDEIRHAELSWRFVAWAIDTGGEPVREAVARTFRSFMPPPEPKQSLAGVSLTAFEEHGRLVAKDARRIAMEAIDQIVRPCACALLARPARRARSQPHVHASALVS